jgi:hypothetical protein
VKATLHFLFALAALLLIPTTAHAQTNLRAWHAAGQTWLVWEDNVTPTPSTYRIYMSTTAAVVNVTLATQVGRLFPEDWQAQRLAVMTPGATWRIADAESLFTVEAQTPANDDSSIWLLGLTLDATPGFARRLDDGAVTGTKVSRRDPESFFGDDELLVSYTLTGAGPSQMRTVRTGIYHRAPAVGFTRNGAQYELTLPTKSGATYQLQWSPDLTGWQPLGAPFLGDSFDETLPITPTADPRQFYRVSIRP